MVGGPVVRTFPSPWYCLKPGAWYFLEQSQGGKRGEQLFVGTYRPGRGRTAANESYTLGPEA